MMQLYVVEYKEATIAPDGDEISTNVVSTSYSLIRSSFRLAPFQAPSLDLPQTVLVP
jgi:hypothetical protein